MVSSDRWRGRAGPSGFGKLLGNPREVGTPTRSPPDTEMAPPTWTLADGTAARRMDYVLPLIIARDAYPVKRRDG